MSRRHGRRADSVDCSALRAGQQRRHAVGRSRSRSTERLASTSGGGPVRQTGRPRDRDTRPGRLADRLDRHRETNCGAGAGSSRHSWARRMGRRHGRRADSVDGSALRAGPKHRHAVGRSRSRSTERLASSSGGRPVRQTTARSRHSLQAAWLIDSISTVRRTVVLGPRPGVGPGAGAGGGAGAGAEAGPGRGRGRRWCRVGDGARSRPRAQGRGPGWCQGRGREWCRGWPVRAGRRWGAADGRRGGRRPRSVGSSELGRNDNVRMLSVLLARDRPDGSRRPPVAAWSSRCARSQHRLTSPLGPLDRRDRGHEVPWLCS